MQIITKFFKSLWRLLNFVRNCVINLVFILFVVIAFAVVGFVSEGNKEGQLIAKTEQGALLLNLNGYLADNRENIASLSQLLQVINEDEPRQISTFDVVYAIESAAEDSRITGLVLDLNNLQDSDLPALSYIGEKITKFKQSGKPVIAYADNFSQSQYFLASYADEIYLNPVGAVSIEGMASENLYFKTLLEKLEVSPHIFRVGTYKSAVEPFLRNDMSPEAKNNLQLWLSQMWKNYVQQVSANREINEEELLPPAKDYVAGLKALKGDVTAYVKQRNLITDTLDHFQLNKKLGMLFGKSADGQAKLFSFDDYLYNLPDLMEVSDHPNKIAVVNVEGTIIDGKSDEIDVGGDTVAKLLRQAREDKQVKGVILRVNSPGGSAFASELIRQEIDHLQQAKKPVVVSMGALAASGGYWISSTADYIIADPNTITGSIGIFAMFPTFEKTIKKMGISADGVATTDMVMRSHFSQPPAAMNEIIQLEIEHGYDRFLTLVSKGRKLDKAHVDSLAQGKIWLGAEAYKQGLVDELGSFELAINKVGELINKNVDASQKIEDFSVEWLVDEENSMFTTLARDLKQNSQQFIQTALGEFIGIPQEHQQIKQQLGVLTKFNDPKGQYLYCLNCGVRQ